MRVVIQRVQEASVIVNNNVKSSIKQGLLILLGIESSDSSEDIYWLTRKIASLRIFNDASGIMNQSIKDVKGEIVVVSQFTLHAKTKKGNRPSYIRAADPKNAIVMYKDFKKELSAQINQEVCSGEFGANMQIKLINDGPVTIIIDSKNRE